MSKKNEDLSKDEVVKFDFEKYLDENEFNRSMLEFVGMSSDMIGQIASVIELRYMCLIQEITENWDEYRLMDEEGLEGLLMLDREKDSIYEDLRSSQAEWIGKIEKSGILEEICFV